MADRKPLDPKYVKNEQERVARQRYYELLKERAMQTPAVPQTDPDGTFKMVLPQNAMERGSDQTVYVKEPDGGAKQLGIDEYVRGDMPPLDPGTLRQDWGDARLSQASNPDQMRDYTLDGTVRYEGEPDNGQFIARNASGEDETVPPDTVDGYLVNMGDDKPGYELYGDAAKKAYERLKSSAAPTEPVPTSTRPSIREQVMALAQKNENPRYAAVKSAVDSYGVQPETPKDRKKGVK